MIAAPRRSGISCACCARMWRATLSKKTADAVCVPLLFMDPMLNTALTFEEMQLILHIFPFIGIGRRVDFFDDGFPDFGQLGIQRGEMSLALRQIILGINCLYRAFRHT